MVSLDSQSHLLNCFVLKNSINELKNNNQVKYEDIFDSVDKQVPAIKLLNKIVMSRDILLEKLPATS